MRKLKYSEKQIAFHLKQVDDGTSVEEVCRKAGFAQHTYYQQRKLLDGLSRSMVAGVSDTLHDMEWNVGLIDARAPKPGRRGL